MRKLNPPLPREHGAWVMWLLPFCMGAVLGQRLTVEVVSLLLVCTGLFCLRFTLVNLIKKWRRGNVERKALLRWSVLHLLLVLSFSSPLYRHAPALLLLAPGVLLFLPIDLLFVARKWDKNLPFELAGIAGLTFSGPAAVYVSMHRITPTMLWLWLFCFLYFLGTVFHVRLLKVVLTRREGRWSPRDKASAGASSAAFLVVATILLLAGDVGGWLPPGSWILLVPSILKAAFTLARLGETPINLRRSGVTEIFHALLFGAMGVWVLGS